MKKLMILVIILFNIIPHNTFAQINKKIIAGIGAGLDYGGFGAQLSYLLVDRVVLFGALGYNLNSLGYNFGGKLKFPTEKRLEFFISGMYGYNAVLIVKGDPTSKTTYYGPTIGAGTILKSGKSEKIFFSFEVFVPFRIKEYHNAIDGLKLLGYDVKKPLPVAFSLGFHIKFR